MKDSVFMSGRIEETSCPLEDVGAYLDGDLAGDQLARFENHLKACERCAAELRGQRQLLCMLDAAFNSPSFSLPHDFDRVMTVRAESDLRGIRKRVEQRRAVQLCAALTATSFALMGGATRGIVFDPVRSFLTAADRFLSLVMHAGLEIAESAGVILRVIARGAFLAPNAFGLILLTAFIFSVSLLPVLIVRYHRAEI